MEDHDASYLAAAVAGVLLVLLALLGFLAYATGIFPTAEPAEEAAPTASRFSAAQLLREAVCAAEPAGLYRVTDEDHAAAHKVLLNTSDTEWAYAAGYWKEPGTDRWVPVDTTATTITTDQRITTNTPAHTTELTCQETHHD